MSWAGRTFTVQTFDIRAWYYNRRRQTGGGGAEEQRAADEPRAERGSLYNDLIGTLNVYGKPVPSVCGNAPILGDEIYRRANTVTEGVERYTGIWSFGDASPGSRLVRLWLGNLLVYDARNLQDVRQNGGLEFRYWSGSADQPVDPIIEADYPSSPWGNRWLKTVTIVDWDISQTDNKNPSGVKAEIWENFVESESIDEIPNSEPAGTFQLGYDKDTGVLYNFNTGGAATRKLFAINTYTDTVLWSVGVDQAGSQLQTTNYVFKHPSLPDLFVGGRDETGAGGDTRLYRINPYTGTILNRSVVIPNALAISLHFTIVKPGGNYYFLCISTLTAGTEIWSYDPSVGTWTEMGSHPSQDYRLIVTGADNVSNESVAYLLHQNLNDVYKIVIDSAGGFTETLLFSRATNAEEIAYSTEYDMLCINGNGEYQIVDGTTGAVLKDSTITAGYILASHANQETTDWFGFVNEADEIALRIDCDTFAETTYSDQTSTINVVGIEGFQVGSSGSLWAHSQTVASGMYRYTLANMASARYTLKADLEKRAQDAGLTSSDYDFTDVTDSIDFSAITDNISFAQHARDTARFFGYLPVTTDKVYFLSPPTSGTSPTVDATLDTQSLVSVDASGIVTTDQANTDTTYAVEMTYVSPDELEYEWTNQRVARSIFPDTPPSKSRPLRVRAPYGITSDEAATLGGRLLYKEAQGRVSYTFSVGMRDMDIQPGSLVDVTGSDGQAVRVYVDMGQSWDWPTRQWRCEGRSYLNVHALSFTGSAGSTLADNVIGRPATWVWPLALPMLDTSLDQDGAGLVNYFMLTSKGQSDWSGGTALFQLNGSSTWIQIGTISSTFDPMFGYVATPLATTATPGSVDTVNSFTIRPVSGDASVDLVTISQATFDAKGGNYIALGINGRFEIVMARDVVDNGDGSYTLDHLHRAQFGTEPYIDGHIAGDYFYILKTDYLMVGIFEPTRLNTNIQVIGIGEGQSVLDGDAVTFTLTGEAEKAYLPSNISVSSADGKNIDFTWTAPASTFVNEKKYRIEILDQPEPSGVVIGTFGDDDDSRITTEAFTLTEANIITLFGSNPTTIQGYISHGTDIDGHWGHRRYFDEGTGLNTIEIVLEDKSTTLDVEGNTTTIQAEG